MPLNKTKGEMYPWATHTWNPIKWRTEVCYSFDEAKEVIDDYFGG